CSGKRFERRLWIGPGEDRIPGLIAYDSGPRNAHGDVIGGAYAAVDPINPLVPNLQWKIRASQQRRADRIRKRTAFHASGSACQFTPARIDQSKEESVAHPVA